MSTLFTPQQLLSRLDSIRLIDVRTPAEFEAVHIEGATSMPLDRLDPAHVRAFVGTPCVFVCQSGKRAAQACDKLAAAGCENLAVLEGGVAAWEQAGLPVKRGRQTLSLERQVRIAATSSPTVFGPSFSSCNNASRVVSENTRNKAATRSRSDSSSFIGERIVSPQSCSKKPTCARITMWLYIH